MISLKNNLKLIEIVIVLILISCNNQPKNQPGKNNLQEQQVNQSLSDTSEYPEESDDCIFDQTTQTDEFLKNVSELAGYKWDYESRTASFKFDNGDSLFLTRGGCYHFGVSAEFRLRNDTTDFKNWNKVYDKALWIAKLLEKDFQYDLIKNEIDSNKVSIEPIDEGEAVYFSDEYLQNNHYEIIRRLEKDVKIIILSYYFE